jgi:lipopolysaccharide/colanic/teichoic acid biosynthesis glycosyltransferase
MKLLLTEKNQLFHKLNSKTCFNNQTILIMHYDYFLHKRDFKILLQLYQTVFLLPVKNEIQVPIQDTVHDFIHHYPNLTIVYNPLFNETFEQSVEISLSSNQHIHIFNIYDFCVQQLSKCYIAEDINNINPDLSNLTYFSYRIRLLKKIIDLGIGIPLYILTQPLWIFSAFKTYQESPGPIFFRQIRVGIRNGEFSIVKFRSMRLDAEKAGAQFSSKNDNRIFGWGKVMRSTRIDELPQLFNILKGELSLIGPRPERKVFIESFQELIPHYNERHAVKPGISGYAQVMYAYGSGVNDARHKLMYDLYYIKYWSLGLEIKIAFLTFWTMISKRGL